MDATTGSPDVSSTDPTAAAADRLVGGGGPPPPRACGGGGRSAPDLMGLAWVIGGFVSFIATMVLAYRPSLDSPGEVVTAIAPWLILAGMVPVLGSGLYRSWRGVELSPGLLVRAAVVTVAAWSVMMLDDDRWMILTFALYAVCYSTATSGRWFALALSGVVSLVWAVAWLLDDSPVWTVMIPFGVFVTGGLIFMALYRLEELNAQQANLIRELNETRRDLADTERSRGMLEERSRLASEIHDTLAQGFTSIVLLARAGRRSGDSGETLEQIEATAQDNLEAARRLVDATRPTELDRASLVEAIDRHVATALPDGIDGRFRVVGEPRPLTGSVEVTLLRATQEALSNIKAHARAETVDITLSYLDDSVALDVRDDGVGFTEGQVTDRGSLTGGQGLDVLDRRARSLSGRLSIESGKAGGSVLSLLLPAAGR